MMKPRILGLLTFIVPTQYYPILVNISILLRESEAEEVEDMELERQNKKVISFLGTRWEYTREFQWDIQLAENQASHWNRKVLIFDAFGVLHRLKRSDSNLLQTATFNKMMEDLGVTV